MRRIHIYAIAAIYFLAIVLLTDPVSYGDTPVYAADVINSVEKLYSKGVDPMWEFGHLLWRPLGFITASATRAVMPNFLRNDTFLQIYFAFTFINLLTGFGCAIVLAAIGRRAGLPPVRCILLCVIFTCMNAVLNYSQAGTSYVPGLFFQLLAVYFFMRAADGPGSPAPFSIAAGVSLAMSALLWFVYVLTIPAILLFGFMWKREDAAGESGPRLRSTAAAAVAAGAVLTLVYGVVAISLDIATPAKFLAWYKDASHGLSQNRQLLRAPMGLARAFIELGHDGVFLKRFLLKDPYSPVSAADLFGLSLWKLVVAYAGLAALFWTALRARDGKRALIPYLAAVAPVLLFAILLFETSQSERYLPFFAAMVPVAAIAIREFSWKRHIDKVLAACFATIVTANLMAHQTGFDPLKQKALARIAEISPRLNQNGRVALLSFRDEISGFYNRFPFERISPHVLSGIYYLVEPSSTFDWRNEFSAMALRTWTRDGDVWFSKRFLSSKPESDWEWTEGDDPLLRWADIPAFFGSLAVDASAGGEDGFVRISKNAANRALLESRTQAASAQSAASK